MTSTIVDLPTLDFAGSLVGFPGSRRFALVRVVPENEVLFRLTALDGPAPGVEFVVAAPFPFFPSYEPEIDDTSAERLELEDASDAILLVLLTVGDTLETTTANLFAPIVVNIRTRQAAQVVLTGSRYSLREPVVRG
jgi:flagellar assembly factor FliW